MSTSSWLQHGYNIQQKSTISTRRRNYCGIVVSLSGATVGAGPGSGHRTKCEYHEGKDTVGILNDYQGYRSDLLMQVYLEKTWLCNQG